MLKNKDFAFKCKETGCSAVGSALGSGPRGRVFKSRHSDQDKRAVF